MISGPLDHPHSPTLAMATRFDWKRGCAGALLWAVAAELCQPFSSLGVGMGLVWPPDGIAIGLVLAYGPRMMPAIGAGVLLWHAAHGIGAARSLTGFTALMLTMAAVWWLVRRSRQRPEDNPAAATLRYHLHTALAAALLLTAAGSWQFLLGAHPPDVRLADIAAVMFVSELFGVLLFCRLTELAVQALDTPGQRFRLALAPWQAAWLLAWAAVAAGAHLGAAGHGLDAGALARYVVFVLVAWAAGQGGPLFVHAVTALSAITLLALAPAGGDATRTLLEQAVLVVCLACLGFLVCATMEHHRAMERRLLQAANHDPLTGLLNERGLLGALRTPQARQYLLIGVVVRNLDQIGELLGLPASREIEHAVADVLRGALPEAPLLARPHGGFFVACAPADADAGHWCARLRALLDDRRWSHGDRSVRIQVAVAAMAPGAEAQAHEDALAALLLACQIASDMPGDAAARAAGHAPGDLMRARRAQLGRLEALKEALHAPAADQAAPGRSDLWLACQPIQRAESDAAGAGAEVLLRWRTADGEPVTPADFLPLAERHGLMPQVDRWVVTQTVQALTAHAGAGLVRMGRVAINLSGASVSDPRLLDHIVTAIRDGGLPASLFCFEITETAGITRPAEAAQLLAGLRALGAETALDDFGTGLASFDYLKSLPLDIVKIDGRFVRDILTDRVDQRIVAATCDVARARGLRTVAEFVETPQQRTLLAAYGVDYVQGYAIARPLPLREYLAGL
ncbi:EAL domain-containing protein [Ramlibacter sp. H39-3-26]|uniref:EAL domain-containing protein n=1 Tax=Curvibacter soli TaxID=3031331 RepID=UPI0023DB1331|nr:EAL domain-containing protein [Ramlibacter sp. H39-3-26]MDF1483890.1 EAL domain-containing protein [Ramlibacter sp. H39-3-26]